MIDLLQCYKSEKVRLFMVAMLCVASFTVFLLPSFSKVVLQIFLLFSLPLLFYKIKIFQKDFIFFLFLSAFAIQTFSWISSTIFYPEIANEYPRLDRLLKLFTFLFIAFWLNGSQKNFFLIMLSFMLGFLIGVFVYPNFYSDFTSGLNGHRVDFGFKNAQYLSMLSGVFIILSFFYMMKCIFMHSLLSKLKIILVVFLSFLSLVLILLIIFSQARQVWLSITLLLIFLPILIQLIYSKLSLGKLLCFYGVLFILLFSISKVSVIEKRLAYTFIHEYNLFSNALDQEKVKSVGNGVRINSWFDSIDWITENPILGAGPNAIGEVITSSERLSTRMKKRFGHLHSFHLEILVAYGILGSLVIYSMYYWIIRSLVLAHRENPELKMFTVLGICFLIFWIIINFFESFSSRSYGVYVHNIMFGCLYTFYFTQQRKKIEEAEACA